jgi:hypothetical protein
MRYEELLGSDLYFQELLMAVEQLPDVEDERFLVVRPGNAIEQSDFVPYVE